MSTEFESNAPSVGYRIGQIAHGLAGEELCNVRVALLCSCPGLLSVCAHPPRPEQNLNSMVCSVTTGSFHACGTASAPMVSKQPYYDGFPSPHDSRGRQHVVSIIFRLAMPGSGLGHSASPFKTTEAPSSHNSVSARRRPLKNRGANRTKPADPQACRAALVDGVRGAAPWAFAREIGSEDLGLRRLYSLDNDM